MEEDSAVTLVKAPPTELIARLRAGELDTALVSSIEAVRAPGYRVVPGIGIACKEEVRSVRAFRRRGETIHNVGCDASSATSVALLQLLLRGPRVGEVAADVAFATIAPTRTPALLPHDLVLLIGDHGLSADPGDREVWDLGREWRRWTGLPFVFALWLLRPGADEGRILPILHRAQERGLRRRDVDGTFGAVHYRLDDEDLRGLRQFWAAARAAGLATRAEAALAGHSAAEGVDA